MAASADISYIAQMYTDGRYEITRTEDTGDGGSKDTVISTGTYEAMEFGYWMEDGTTGEWQAITLAFPPICRLWCKILIFRYINNPPAFRQGDRFAYKKNQNSSFFSM